MDRITAAVHLYDELMMKAGNVCLFLVCLIVITFLTECRITKN